MASSMQFTMYRSSENDLIKMMKDTRQMSDGDSGLHPALFLESYEGRAVEPSAKDVPIGRGKDCQTGLGKLSLSHTTGALRLAVP